MCVSVYIRIYNIYTMCIYTYMRTRIYVYIPTRIYVYTRICMYVYLHIRIYAYIHIYTYVDISFLIMSSRTPSISYFHNKRLKTQEVIDTLLD